MALNRRDLLRSGAVAAIGAAGLGCPLRREPQTAPLPVSAAVPPGGRGAWADTGAPGLARVDVAPEREIRTIVGLRPFRATGFRVETERLDDKVLVHNYGHGGAGVTFSWGTSQLAVEQALAAAAETGMSNGWGDDAAARQTPGRGCAVLGCGVIGLSTAILMQRQGWQVTIYARDLPPHTTSNVAGALWGPYAVSDPGRADSAFQRQFVSAARLAHRRFQEMVGDHYNIRWIETYDLSNAPQPPPWFEQGTEDLYPEARALAPAEHPFPRAHAISYRTMLIEPHAYLDALLRDFYIAGGHTVVREFVDLRDVATLTEPLLFNCTGLGAMQLVGDDEMEPVRGQLTFLLPQPDVDYVALAGELYMFPRSDGILLGGTHERGNWSLEPDRATARRIVQGHAELFGQNSVPVAAKGSSRGGATPRW
ncbi:MAG: FAD-dependent oxidoreductase [Acidobacteriota bacterium]|jgi:glycine/D-amino acid oxidase-like deaminating enzyme